MKQIYITLVILFLGYSLYGEIPSRVSDFKNAVYGQTTSITEAEQLFLEADNQARNTLSGSDLYTMLPRCEYLMGRVYQDNNLQKEASVHYEKGISWAERSLENTSNSEAYEMIASLIGQLCMIKSTPWVMANGLKVEENAKKALQIDNLNAGALYLLASRWAFGPGIFGNPKRGITELEAILNSPAILQTDDYFNVYSALGYANLRLNRHEEALSWTQRALALYPTNKFALDLESQIKHKHGEIK